MTCYDSGFAAYAQAACTCRRGYMGVALLRLYDRLELNPVKIHGSPYVIKADEIDQLFAVSSRASLEYTGSFDLYDRGRCPTNRSPQRMEHKT